jgi:predicted nucleic acid-binding protein
MSDELLFFDTNILVYANDNSAHEKRSVARAVIREAIRDGRGNISTQVLAEFWVTATQKMKPPLDKAIAKQEISLFQAFSIQPVDQATVLEALRLQEQYQISYWDAQIITSAALANCRVLYSEDLQNGREYGGVKIINPFIRAEA